MIPNRVLKDFAPELAPLVMDIYNCSLREGYDPDLLKRSIINPLPKVSPPQEIQSDLRPIFLTCTLAKVMEGFARCRLVAQISEKLHHASTQGRGTPPRTPWFKSYRWFTVAADRGNCGARMFFADYSKGFDLIDHSSLLRGFTSFDIDPLTILIYWIRAFLTGRWQAVKLETLCLTGSHPGEVSRKGRNWVWFCLLWWPTISCVTGIWGLNSLMIPRH